MKKAILLTMLILVACTTPAVPISTSTVDTRTIKTTQATQVVLPTATLTDTAVFSTPTDVVPVSTATSQPPATCPLANQKVRLPLSPVFKDKKAPYHDARTATLNFLNQGGDPKAVIEKLAEYSVYASSLDLTHDGVPELILPSGYLTVFGCKDGQYIKLLDIPPSEHDMTAVPLAIQDLNQNGLLEILIGQVASTNIATYQLYEWDGVRFANFLPDTFNSRRDNIYILSQTIYAVGQSNAEKGAFDGNWEIVDAGNGPKRIVIRAGVYDSYIASSELENSLILQWNGEYYDVAKFLTESTPTSLPTYTPLPYSATCANKVPELRFTKPETADAAKPIIGYLNAGGNPEQLKGFYNTTIQDLNNDTAPEILLIDDSEYEPYVMMFTCQYGKYVEAVSFPNEIGTFQMSIMAVKDNNKNGFTEVFIEDIGCFNLRCGALYVVEWDGGHFVQRIRDFSYDILNYADMSEPNDAYLKDIDDDGIGELIWTGELIPEAFQDRWLAYPQRLATHIYKWDGVYYTAHLIEYGPPDFRYQAVQDGDRYSKAGLYEKALKSYQLAITSDALKWWTNDLYNYTVAPYGLGPCAENLSACPHPTSAPKERPILSAYASFKKMVVYLLTNESVKADATYKDILKSHPVGTPGSTITEMATVFWDEYQSTQDIATACTQSIAYIKNQPDVLSYLTGGYNGYADQGIDYKNHPDEICPFK